MRRFHAAFQNEEQRQVSERTKHYEFKFSKKEYEERNKHFASTRSLFDRNKYEKEFNADVLHLSKELREIYNVNPHMRQALVTQSEWYRWMNLLQIEIDM